MQRTPRLSHVACRLLARPVSQAPNSLLPKLSTCSITRSLSQSTCFKYPRKDSQHKDSINPEATEYSKSGTDDASARHADTAFDPHTTRPAEQKDKVGKDTGASDNPLEVLELVEILDCVKYLLNNAAVHTSSSNLSVLDDLFKAQKNVELLCKSSLFEWAKKANSSKTTSTLGCPLGGCGQSRHNTLTEPIGDSSPSEECQQVSGDRAPGDNENKNAGDVSSPKESGVTTAAGAAKHTLSTYRRFRQLSAELHCLYGVPIQHLPRSSIGSHHHNLRVSKGVKLHPYARSQVYDLRQHQSSSFWGPFKCDGSQNVDWEKVESLMVILAYNIQRFADRYSVHGLALIPPWDKPFIGVTPSGLSTTSPEIERPIPLPLECRDPYDVTGVWMRVVCFLDYRELFTFNFSEDQPLVTQRRPPLEAEEAIRFIVIKLHATGIEEPGENDGKGLPVVHFQGVSASALPPVDPNANSSIRGTVRLTPQGEVRWTTFSVFHGEERWRSEGIQIGGRRCARGIIGFWFDKDFDPYGPAGPTAFWKVSDDPEEESFSMETV
ncbi:MAG: hypothetical protein LQ345_007194 [Seirophora villosa]|nr:MAG: hypothetical protein LQ345_007194 [Seirophora villosa]